MEIGEVLVSRWGLSVDGSVLSNNCMKESDDGGSDSGSCEKLLLEEMDSYWEDLNARLTVSRMVSDSIIKGMVNAIQQEAAEKIDSKEEVLAVLNEKLKHYESNADNGNGLEFSVKLKPQKPKSELLQCSIDARQELDFVKQLDRLRIAAEEKLQRFPQVAPKYLVSEQQWEEEIQMEIGSVMVQSFIRSLQDEFEMEVCEQRSLINTISRNWRKSVDEFSAMRQDLNNIYGSLFNSESIEEWNSGKMKDHFSWKPVDSHLSSTLCTKEVRKNTIVMEKSEESRSPMPNDSPQLKCMAKDELITYFKSEMNRMSRQHDLALDEKTEELFKLKRYLLNVKGSTPLHFRKEKDFDPMKKKFLELISKLDDILSENKELPIIYDSYDVSQRLKERLNSLFLENKWLQCFLADERKVTRCVVPQVSSIEPNFTEEMERLQLAMEELEIEATIKEEIYKSVLKDLVSEFESNKEALEMVTKVVEDNYSIIYGEAIADVISNLNHIKMKFYEDKYYISRVLLEKEMTLCLELEENERLKQEIGLLSTLVTEKEKLASEAGSKLLQQKEQFDLLCHELNMFRDQVSKQEMIISKTKAESDLLKDKLDETFQQIHQNEDEISNLNQKIMIISDALEESERQKGILHSNIQEMHEELVSAITKGKEQKKQLIGSIIVSMMELSKAIGDCECRLTQKMETNESRFKVLSYQCRQFKQQANLLNRKVLWYKERFEARCQDLQKAETEVDLLGDEVDTLLDLLGKIYMALDHYSPVLQHYPGVVETLKLIRRKLKVETTKLA